jgi:hypothetical protein
VRYLPSSRYLRAQRLASIHSARRLRLLALQVRLGLTARYSSAPHWLRARLVLQQALRSAMGAERRRRQGLPVLELQGLAPDGAGFKCKDGVASLFLLVTSEGEFHSTHFDVWRERPGRAGTCRRRLGKWAGWSWRCAHDGRTPLRRRSRLLRGPTGRTHVPALALSFGIPLEFGAATQLSAGLGLAGAATPALDVRSVATSASGVDALGTSPNMTLAHIADRSNSPQKTLAMRCNCEADSSNALTTEASCCLCTTRRRGGLEVATRSGGYGLLIRSSRRPNGSRICAARSSSAPG